MCARTALTLGHYRSSVESLARCVAAVIRDRGGQTQYHAALSIYMVGEWRSGEAEGWRTLRLQGAFLCLCLFDIIFRVLFLRGRLLHFTEEGLETQVHQNNISCFLFF